MDYTKHYQSVIEQNQSLLEENQMLLQCLIERDKLIGIQNEGMYKQNLALSELTQTAKEAQSHNGQMLKKFGMTLEKVRKKLVTE